VAGSGNPLLTPRRAFERIQESTLQKDPTYADLYAADGVHEMPFAPPGVPRRIEGRENIRAFLNRAAGTAPMTFKEFRNVRIHEMTDPGTIICEYDLHGEVSKTGDPFVFSYILLVTVRNGEIARVRDYMDTLAMTAVLGGLGGTSP
jgi:uncharacterized protein